jgi:hypothetical protein
MQITITVSEKSIKNALENMLEGNIYENYDSDVRELAGVPKKAELIKIVMADKKYMAALAKELAYRFDPEDYLYDYVWDVACKPVSDLVKKCDKAFEKIDDLRHSEAETKAKQLKEAEEEATVARVVAILKKQGYKITKE